MFATFQSKMNMTLIAYESTSNQSLIVSFTITQIRKPHLMYVSKPITTQNS